MASLYNDTLPRPGDMGRSFDNECRICGVGSFLPSDMCDHCNSPRPTGKPEYVVGFLFVQPYAGAETEVVLVRKLKPAWQKGRLNGVGGKVEPDERPLGAMIREFREETGDLNEYNWERFFQTELSDCVLHFFRAFSTQSSAHTVEKEVILFVNVNTLRGRVDFGLAPTINNLQWLIPLALSGESLVAKSYETK